MAMEQVVFTLLISTGLVAGQASIITEPTQQTGLRGEIAAFTCGVDFGAGSRVVQWLFKDTNVYSFDNGFETYPPGFQDKYSVEQDGTTFTLTVHDLEFDDGGVYWCRPIGVGANAQLIVLGVPNPFSSILTPTEGTEVMFTCEADFGAGNRSNIADDHYPTMQMIFNGNIVAGEVTERYPDGPFATYRFTQNFSITAEWTDDGEEVTCEIRSANPDVHSIGRLTVNVLYPVQMPFYSPVPENDKYEVGNIVNCSANGNPTPNYQWKRTGQVSPIYGQSLHITDGMIGLINIWTCTASNTVDGWVHEDSVTVEFSIDDNGDNGSFPEVAVIVISAVVVVIIAITAVIMLVYIWKRFKRKRPQVRESQVDDIDPYYVTVSSHVQPITDDNPYCYVDEGTDANNTYYNTQIEGTEMEADGYLNPVDKTQANTHRLTN